jgi:hypothetical protein
MKKRSPQPGSSTPLGRRCWTAKRPLHTEALALGGLATLFFILNKLIYANDHEQKALSAAFYHSSRLYVCGTTAATTATTSAVKIFW